MAGGHAQTFELETAWEASVSVCAAAFGVDPQLLSAPSRGRGPRPPEMAREPKKLAVYLAITLTGGDYAALGRHVGLHKDTVASHCADLRDRCAEDVETETRVDALVVAATHRAAAARPEPAPRAAGDVTTAAMAAGLNARLDRIEKLLVGLMAHPTVHPTLHPTADFAHPTGSDEGALHPTLPEDHGNVIAFPGTPGDAA